VVDQKMAATARSCGHAVAVADGNGRELPVLDHLPDLAGRDVQQQTKIAVTLGGKGVKGHRTESERLAEGD
jgi:hypothetical protein